MMGFTPPRNYVHGKSDIAIDTMPYELATGRKPHGQATYRFLIAFGWQEREGTAERFEHTGTYTAARNAVRQHIVDQGHCGYPWPTVRLHSITSVL